jgi:hypothetical protein
MLWGNRNRLYYVLYPVTGEFFALLLSRTTWTERIDENGHPVILPPPRHADPTRLEQRQELVVAVIWPRDVRRLHPVCRSSQASLQERQFQ